jgi:hypothetical protein
VKIILNRPTKEQFDAAIEQASDGFFKHAWREAFWMACNASLRGRIESLPFSGTGTRLSMTWVWDGGHDTVTLVRHQYNQPEPKVTPSIQVHEDGSTVVKNHAAQATIKVPNADRLKNIELFQRVREHHTFSKGTLVFLTEFFADIESRHSAVMINEMKHEWGEIAHVFHDLDAV